MDKSQKDIIEKCAKRVEAYAFSLEVQRHIGLPDAITALGTVATKIRELKGQSMNFSIGQQPCDNFKGQIEYHDQGSQENRHQCHKCGGTVSFCLNCSTDHHENGYETCFVKGGDHVLPSAINPMFKN